MFIQREYPNLIIHPLRDHPNLSTWCFFVLSQIVYFVCLLYYLANLDNSRRVTRRRQYYTAVVRHSLLLIYLNGLGCIFMRMIRKARGTILARNIHMVIHTVVFVDCIKYAYDTMSFHINERFHVTKFIAIGFYVFTLLYGFHAFSLRQSHDENVRIAQCGWHAYFGALSYILIAYNIILDICVRWNYQVEVHGRSLNPHSWFAFGNAFYVVIILNMVINPYFK